MLHLLDGVRSSPANQNCLLVQNCVLSIKCNNLFVVLQRITDATSSAVSSSVDLLAETGIHTLSVFDNDAFWKEKLLSFLPLVYAISRWALRTIPLHESPAPTPSADTAP